MARAIEFSIVEIWGLIPMLRLNRNRPLVRQVGDS
jgi:hypothetical protein